VKGGWHLVERRQAEWWDQAVTLAQARLESDRAGCPPGHELSQSQRSPAVITTAGAQLSLHVR
jgi:hypothetical protein